MTLEDLEYELRVKIIEKHWEADGVVDDMDDYFLIQLRGNYKNKELRYTDLLDVGSEVIIITATTYQECYNKLLKENK